MSVAAALGRTLLLARDGEIIGENHPTDRRLLDAFRRTCVVLVADAANLASAAGQHALVALFSNVARLGVTVLLDLPEAPLLGSQPPLRGSELRAALLDLGADLIPRRRARLATSADFPDVAFVVGDTPWRGIASVALRIIGDEWSGTVVQAALQGHRWVGDWPVGGLIAAGLAAAEPFKFAVRDLGTRLRNPIGHRYLASVERAHLRVAPAGTPTGPIAFGELDFVSGGAITNSVLFTLLRLPESGAVARVIEPERADLSNVNRYHLLRRSDHRLLKTAILQRWARPGFTVSGIAVRYEAQTRDSILPLAPRVLVGVDDIGARWAVQRDWPEWLGVGATTHYLALVSAHRRGEPCVGCLHPYADDGLGLIPTVSFVSYWAGLLLAIRLILEAKDLHGTPDQQAVCCCPLRLDQPHAIMQQPVQRRVDCPVPCAA